MYLPAFHVWFARRPLSLGMHVQHLAYSDFPFLNTTNSLVIRQIEAGKSDVALLDYMRFCRCVLGAVEGCAFGGRCGGTEGFGDALAV
jgi:hypothetical protein